MNKKVKKEMEYYFKVIRKQYPPGWVLSSMAVKSEIELMTAIHHAALQEFKSDLEVIIQKLIEYYEECLNYLNHNESFMLMEQQ